MRVRSLTVSLLACALGTAIAAPTNAGPPAPVPPPLPTIDITEKRVEIDRAGHVSTDLLFEVKPFDPLTFLTVAAALGVIAMLASFIPGHRATRVDPVVALRAE